MPTTITPLRQRMIDDMRLRNFAESTCNAYVRAVANYSRFHGRSPDRLDYEDVRTYQLYLAANGLKPATVAPIMCALRFFYRVTMGRKDASAEIPLPGIGDSLPKVLSREEVGRFLANAPTPRWKALFSTIYGAGLRVSEAASLKVGDINSQQMTILIRMGKGRRDRHVMLSPALLPILRDYWRAERPRDWLFPSPGTDKPISSRAVQRACRKMAKRAGLDALVTAHTLRHSFATHLLEQGVDIRVIQELLGHRSILATTRYTRVDLLSISKIKSPLSVIDAVSRLPGS
ncbi:MAG: site-specific integrase [Caldilineaceae bacterium]|nr:site-specific integrase [Caldilineaceae bacterium]